jgi:hypothetical protein
MKRNQTKALILAVAGIALAEAGLTAQAADLTVVDRSSSAIQPYFKSNCWSAAMKANNPDPRQWVFFGGIGARGQFTWTFQDLLDPKCKHPKVSFTYALNGESAPTPGHVAKGRKTTLDWDSTVPVYTITVDDVPLITSVTPSDDDHDGDDD